MDDVKIFETTDVDLGAFLILEEIPFLECKIKDARKGIVLLRFIDDLGKCLDLERVYLSSECKKFRDINKYLLKKIFECKRES